MVSKKKGSDGERELSELLRDHGIRAYRNDQIFKSGLENPDVRAEVEDIQVHIEVKRVEHLNLQAAVKQAVRDANGKALPVVAHRRNREPWLITVPLLPLLDVIGKVDI